MPTETSLQTIQTLYIAYYGRPADPQGLQFWAKRLDEAEGNLEAILDDFGTSEEYTETFGELDDATLVNNLYQQLFGRDAEQEGLDGYVASLESGELTLAEIAAEIAGGAQNEDAEALEAKREAADRFTESLAARPAGQQAYEGADSAQAARDYLAGVTNGEQAESADPEAVVEDLVATASQAYIDEIQKLYVAYYGRPADPDGLAFWTEQALANGGDLASLVEAFGNSEEYTQGLAQLDPEAQVEALYQQLFGREADDEGLALYSEALANGELTLAEIALVIAEGAAEEDQAVIDARVKVAKAVTDSLDSEEAIEEFSSEEGQQAAKELVGGVQSDEQAVEIIEAIESGGSEEGEGEGDGSGIVPAFIVNVSESDEVTFQGNTSGPISFTVDDSGVATFSRDGITATTTVADIDAATISIASNQAMEVDAAEIDGRTTSFIGEGTLNITGVTLNEATESAGASMTPDIAGISSSVATIQVNGSQAEWLQALWIQLDTEYTSGGSRLANYYNDELNESFVLLGVDYVAYLEDGGEPFLDFGAKVSATRDQSMHDNLLGNLSGASITDRFDGQQEQDLLAIAGDYVERPVFSGNDSALYGQDHREAMAFDFDKGWERDDYIQSYVGEIDSSAIDGDELYVGDGNTTDRFTISRHEGAGIELALKAKKTRTDDYDRDIEEADDGVSVYTVDSGVSSLASNRSDWSFDFSVATGLNGRDEETLDDYDFSIFVDIDPSENIDYAEFHLAKTDELGDGTGQPWVLIDAESGDFVDFIAGFSDDDTAGPSISQNSVNFGFGFMQDLLNEYSYTNGEGEFDIRLEASQGDVQLVGTQIRVDVVEDVAAA